MLIDLDNFCNEHFLKQHIEIPTHVAGNTLDLLFTNNDSLLHSYECVKPPQSTSDHYIVKGSTLFNVCKDAISEARPDFLSPFDKLNFHSSEIKWRDINSELEAIIWSTEIQELNPTDILSKILERLQDICNRHVPIKKRASKSSKNKIPRERRRLMRKRTLLTKKLKKAISIARRKIIGAKLINIEILLKKSHQASQNQCEQEAINSIKSNPRYFFSYAKKFSKIKSKVGPSLNENNQYTSSCSEMANLLKNQYKSMFSDPINIIYILYIPYILYIFI